MAPLAASLRPCAGPGLAAPSSPLGAAMGWRWAAGARAAAGWRRADGGERWRGGDRSALAHPAPLIAGHNHAGFHGF